MYEALPHNMGIAQYAKILVRRHSDIGFISATLKREYGRTIQRERLQAMRNEYLRSIEVHPRWPECQHDRTAETTLEVDGALVCGTCHKRLLTDLRRWAKWKTRDAA